MNQRADPIRDSGIVITSEIVHSQKPTQRVAILEMLRAAGSDGLCSLSAYRRGPSFYNARNRVSELGRDGYVIRSDRCVHDEVSPSHVRWTLTREPANSALSSNTRRLGGAPEPMRMVDGSAVRAGDLSGFDGRTSVTGSVLHEVVVPARTVTLTSAQPKSAHQLSLAEAGR
jgi:hypothetical protein